MAVAVAGDAEVEAVVDAEADLVEIPHVGIGFRREIGDWILSSPNEIDCVEVTAEHFFDCGESTLRALADRYPISVHGLGLSLGTPEQIDATTLRQFRQVAEIADAKWISDHIAFTKSGDIDLGHLNPVPRTAASLQTLIAHAKQVMDYCGRPLLLENITSNLEMKGTFGETEFINRLCDQSGCGLLLDVTNLKINSHNHHYDPIDWLHELEPSIIKQIHIVGYHRSGDKLVDRHCDSIQDDLFALTQAVVRYGAIDSIFIERDGNFPSPDDLSQELQRLESACEPT